MIDFNYCCFLFFLYIFSLKKQISRISSRKTISFQIFLDFFGSNIPYSQLPSNRVHTVFLIRDINNVISSL